MGMTGTNAFPCCGKDSVEIVEKPNDLMYDRSPRHEVQDDEAEMEAELLEQEPPPQEDPDLDPCPELEENLKMKPEQYQAPIPKAELDVEPKWKIDTLESCSESSEQQCYGIETIQPTIEFVPALQNFRSWSISSSTSHTEDQESPLVQQDKVPFPHRSIQAQTSRHLFWADKFIQASEHSLQHEAEMQCNKSGTQETTSLPEQKSVPAAQPTLPVIISQPPVSPCLSSSSLPQTIGLADLINFASSLAIASCSNIDLPRLEQMLKTPRKAVELSTEPAGPSAKPIQSSEKEQEPSEKLPKVLELQKAWSQEDRNFPHPFLDLSKSGIKRATIEGEVKFLQPPAMSPQLGEANEEERGLAVGRDSVKSLKALGLVLQEATALSWSFPGAGISSTTPNPGQTLDQFRASGSLPRESPSSKPWKSLRKGSREQKIKRSPSRQIRPPQKPRRLLTWDARQEQGSSMKKGRLQLRSAQVTHREPAATTATKYEQTTRRAREFVDPNATQRAQFDPDARSQSLTEENLLPLTPRQLSAFQDIFKLFSCSPTGTVDMCSLKVVLHNVGIHQGPQEMCEALRLADLDGDGIVSFKDFLGVLTDNHRLAQCMGQVRSSRVCDPQGLQTLFLEVVFKLLRQGLVPSKSGQEVISYYSKKQRVLRLSPSWRGRARGQGRPLRSQPGLNYFCQAARISGLSSSELARSLHRLSRAGARSPYSQIPTLTGRTRPECRKRGRTRVSEVRLPKPYQPSRRKTQLNLRPLCQAGLVTQPLKQMRPAKLAPSLPTLVQKQPFSPSPACLQRSAMKSLYK